MKRPARIAVICLTVGGTAVTLLLWAKLKLVAGIPRTVYAEPEARGDTGEIPGGQIDAGVQGSRPHVRVSDDSQTPPTPTP